MLPIIFSNKKREAINKLALRKGFNVMSSLTRRGASALSISMHNLSTESEANQEHTNTKASSKRPSIINVEEDREYSKSSGRFQANIKKLNLSSTLYCLFQKTKNSIQY